MVQGEGKQRSQDRQFPGFQHVALGAHLIFLLKYSLVRFRYDDVCCYFFVFL